MDRSTCYVEFCLIGTSFDLDDVTRRMNYTPDESRFEQRIASATQLVQVEIDGYTFEKYDSADVCHETESSWCIRTDKVELYDINDPLFDLLKILVPRKQIILDLVEQYALSVVVHFNIDVNEDDGIHGTYLRPSTVNFLNELGASISFDII